MIETDTVIVGASAEGLATAACLQSGRRVLVVGLGNSGGEIAREARRIARSIASVA